MGIFAASFPLQASAAERVAFNYPPFGQFHFKVKDLKAFVATGEVSSELAYFLNRLPPKPLEKLPQLLTTPLELNPLSISKFSHSQVGEAVIRNFGQGIKAKANLNGFHALRGAIINAAFDHDGLTIMNLLTKFPSNTVYLDLSVLTQYLEQRTSLSNHRQTIYQSWFADPYAPVIPANQSPIQQSSLLNLPGTYNWNQQTLTFHNPAHPQIGHFDLYQPKLPKLAPVIIISHGLASNRQTFAYLGKHLASHGFAVVITEHDDISLDKFAKFLSGTAEFPKVNNLLRQPQDVSHILDRLAREPSINSQLDLQQVGIIGQSFGGYSALALAGGRLTTDQANCEAEDHQQIYLDLSSLARCTLNQLEESQIDLRDERIKAVIAINPMSKIFDSSGINSIQIPTMLIAGTDDLIMPPFIEQIKPFTWLDSQLDKYLVLVKPGTHFSFLQEGLGILPVPETAVGPSPTSAHPILKALSTAFFKVHLAQDTQYQQYLQEQRTRQPDHQQNAFEFSLIRTLDSLELEKMFTD